MIFEVNAVNPFYLIGYFTSNYFNLIRERFWNHEKPVPVNFDLIFFFIFLN